LRNSAVRKLVGEAWDAGKIEQKESASLTGIPNISQKGTGLGNWLTREQAKELLAVPDRSTLKSKSDYVILALLVGCALRRNEVAELDVQTKNPTGTNDLADHRCRENISLVWASVS
jgi:integrase